MNPDAIPVALFRLGRIVATAHALEVIPKEDILKAIARHQAGDWGDLPAEDLIANNKSVIEGSRLLSAYHSTQGVKFWVITEADRSITTVLLPEDY